MHLLYTYLVCCHILAYISGYVLQPSLPLCCLIARVEIWFSISDWDPRGLTSVLLQLLRWKWQKGQGHSPVHVPWYGVWSRCLISYLSPFCLRFVKPYLMFFVPSSVREHWSTFHVDLLGLWKYEKRSEVINNSLLLTSFRRSFGIYSSKN
jgi:hypothetical protein